MLVRSGERDKGIRSSQYRPKGREKKRKEKKRGNMQGPDTLSHK